MNYMVANWPNITATVKSTDIKFSNFWWDGYGSYQVHFLDRNVQRNPLVLGWQMEQAFDYVDAHIFVRKNSPTRPAELDDIKRSIQSVVMLNRRTVPQILTTGAAAMRVVRTVDEPLRSFVTDLWHSVLQIEVMYYIATTT
jgi:hypothetical protein